MIQQPDHVHEGREHNGCALREASVSESIEPPRLSKHRLQLIGLDLWDEHCNNRQLNAQKLADRIRTGDDFALLFKALETTRRELIQ